ncbi:MAG: EFR1 family ferrodoxin [Peptoniphilus sp.]|nr:EFR1 family ferrodoxin [Peptoniphilus sp.]
MILYFSGTGNSKYIAKELAHRLKDEVTDLFHMIKEHKEMSFTSEKPYVLVCPTYGWRVPRFLSDFLKKAEFKGNRNFYVVMNCGSSIGSAEKYLREDLKDSKVVFKGLYEIVMPENYIMLFNLDSEEKNAQTIEAAEQGISYAAEVIACGESFNKKKTSIIDDFLSGIVNDVFFKFMVKDKKFYYTDKCNKCGLCAKVCILDNIEYVEGYPRWKGNCTHCAACISKCPRDAIEYGRKTVGKKRYLLK